MSNAENMENTGANPHELGSDEAKLGAKDDPDIHLDHLCKQVSEFVPSLSSIDESHPLETPQFLDDFLETIESKLKHYESEPAKMVESIKSSPLFFNSIDCLSVLIQSVSKFRSVSTSAVLLINLATSLLHRAMLILGAELAVLVSKNEQEHEKEKEKEKENSTPSKKHEHEHEKKESDPNQDEQQQQKAEIFPPISSEDTALISSITKTMITAGYKGECKRLFVKARRSVFEDELTCHGFQKNSIDEVQKMQWEALESEIATWIHVIKQCTSSLFPGELKFYQTIFSSQLSQLSQSKPRLEIWKILFDDLVSAVIQMLLTLAHAVALTKRSAEKLFKFLDMYEALRDLGKWVDELSSSSSLTNDCVDELKAELAPAGRRLGEGAVSIFCELENSIKHDNTKQPVAFGAVHPLTRYVMNYLKYACEYKGTLTELFVQETTSFEDQLVKVMDLLEANVEAKSNLYKDASLRCIFLMNNGRYMLQKIKGSDEMHETLVDMWCRKRSTNVRNYHKNYQRDTWGKCLQCMTQEGLVVNGKVLKPVLKERFKNFNQLFDEIHKTQSAWVVSDEQMKSELRVSISAVMIPAYRAFVARFGPVFTPGRQYEKHIKLQPEDIETAIEELFEGNC